MSSTPPSPVGVLFICMGNICRSPLAEGVFLSKIQRRGVADRVLVESAGTGGWHVGHRADPRVREVARHYGVSLDSTARQVIRADFDRFDHLICMDNDNRSDLLDAGAPPDRVRLLLELDPGLKVREVPDPYYGGADGFQRIYTLIERGCEALLDDLVAPKR